MQVRHFSALLVDLMLTPENATESGYRWVSDVAYDSVEPIPTSLINDFMALLHDGYKLGCARYSISSVDKGLYEPIARPEQER